jgi:hypothetical protein
VGGFAWEFRGASGALDKEHEHPNLPTRGSHIKTDDLSRDVHPHPMVALTDEQRRALQLLAGSPNGCTEAILMAHGFHLAMLGKLAFDGFANVEARETMAGSRRMKVFWLRITEAGRKAIAEWKRPRAEARGQVRGLPKHSIRQGPI